MLNRNRNEASLGCNGAQESARLNAGGPTVVVNGFTMQCDTRDLVTSDGVTWFSPYFAQSVCGAASSQPTFTLVPASQPDSDGNQKYNVSLSSVNWDGVKNQWVPSPVTTTSQTDKLHQLFKIDASPMQYGHANCLVVPERYMSQGSPSTVACKEIETGTVFYVRGTGT